MKCSDNYLYSEASKNDAKNLHNTINTMKVKCLEEVEVFMGSNLFIDSNHEKKRWI